MTVAHCACSEGRWDHLLWTLKNRSKHMQSSNLGPVWLEKKGCRMQPYSSKGIEAQCKAREQPWLTQTESEQIGADVASTAPCTFTSTRACIQEYQSKLSQRWTSTTHTNKKYSNLLQRASTYITLVGWLFTSLEVSSCPFTPKPDAQKFRSQHGSADQDTRGVLHMMNAANHEQQWP